MNELRPGHLMAEYHAPPVPMYQGNPLIEALPPIMKEEEIFEKLNHDLDYDPAQRSLPNEVKVHLLQALKYFFQPLPRHLALVQGIELLLRSGYVSRNPFPRKTVLSSKSLDSASLMGSSGTGKSYSIAQALNMMPQVIHHTEYAGKPFNTTQVVWLKLECPHDGSPRALCISFFQKLDEVLGTTYGRDFGGTRSTVSTMIPTLGRLCQQHSIGLVVIDELQNLNAIVKGHILLNFIVQLTNDLAVPILMVGTSNAKELFNEAFRLARRSTGFLQPEWDRMTEASEEWQMFTNALWRYQYLKAKTKLTDELRHELYQQTCGIADLAVKLYFLVQLHALNEELEAITPELMREVAAVAFVLNRTYLENLRTGRHIGKKMGDLVPQPIFEQAELFVPPPAKGKRKSGGKGHVSHENTSSYEAFRRQGDLYDPARPFGGSANP